MSEKQRHHSKHHISAWTETETILNNMFATQTFSRCSSNPFWEAIPTTTAAATTTTAQAPRNAGRGSQEITIFKEDAARFLWIPFEQLFVLNH